LVFLKVGEKKDNSKRKQGNSKRRTSSRRKNKSKRIRNATGPTRSFPCQVQKLGWETFGPKFRPPRGGEKEEKEKEKKSGRRPLFFSFSFSSSSPLWVPKKKIPHCVQLPMKLPPAPPEEGTSAPQIRNPNP